MAYPISDVPRRIVYSGSAGVGPYAFTFEVLANTDIAVYKNTTLLTLTTDYTVSINAGTGTGTVTLVVAATGADSVTLVGDRAIQRTSDFVTGGDLFASTLNDELDSLTIAAQQVDEKADRAIRARVTDPTTLDMTLPAYGTRANKLMGFTSGGAPTTTTSTVAQIDAAVSSFVNATGNNASSILYTPAGTSAVPTTVQSKLRETVSVLDFGADPTGNYDSTMAIQAAANIGAAQILVPPGTYLLNQYVTLQSGQSWIGSGNPVIKMKNNAGIPRCAFYMQDDTDILIHGITFDGNGSNQTNYNTVQKSLVEIQSFCQRVTLRDVVVKNALQWGVMLKGNTTLGQPRDITLDNVTTMGSLGTGTGGVPGSDGNTGIAWVAGENITIVGGTSFDYFDIESNTPTTQLCEGIITGRVFRAGADVGFNVKVIGNTFLMPIVNTVACRVTYQYAQIIGNQFIEIDPQTNAKPRAGAWIGIGIEANNTSFLNIQGNVFAGTDYCAIAPRRLGFCNVTENTIYCSSTDIVSTVTYDSVAFHYGAIVMPSGAIRDAVIDGNKVTGNSAFTLAQIDLATTDQRQLVVTDNSVGHLNATSLGKLYVYGTRGYDQQITSNSALVSTSYTTTNTMDVVEVRGKKVYYVKPNTTAPTDGTHQIGDTSYTSAPVSGGYIGIVCTAAAKATTGTINSGSTAMAVANGTGIVNGVSITVVGAGVAGGNLVTTVASGGGTSNLILAAAASTSVTGAAVTTAETWKTFGLIS